jgi:hypothetical protein
MSKHPNNGPTFSKRTIKKPRPAVASPTQSKRSKNKLRAMLQNRGASASYFVSK